MLSLTDLNDRNWLFPDEMSGGSGSPLIAPKLLVGPKPWLFVGRLIASTL